MVEAAHAAGRQANGHGWQDTMRVHPASSYPGIVAVPGPAAFQGATGIELRWCWPVDLQRGAAQKARIVAQPEPRFGPDDVPEILGEKRPRA